MIGQVLIVGLGGFLGANARYWLAVWIGTRPFPWATLFVNLIGSFGLAFIAAYLLNGRHTSPEPWKLFIGTGIFGAFTTYSTFNLETLLMLEDGRYLSALAYLSASLILGLGAGIVGLWLARGL